MFIFNLINLYTLDIGHLVYYKKTRQESHQLSCHIINLHFYIFSLKFSFALFFQRTESTYYSTIKNCPYLVIPSADTSIVVQTELL